MNLTLIASTSPRSQSIKNALEESYFFGEIEKSEVIVVVGGDGFMLRTLRRYASYKKPYYGINGGTVGFLMNTYMPSKDLPTLIHEAVRTILPPLKAYVHTDHHHIFEIEAINEIALMRASAQACKLHLSINGRSRLDQLVGDGVLLATPAGSTGYNRSAHGTIIPLGANLLALTPLNAYAPRRWHGALLNDDARIIIDVLQPECRPVYLTADDQKIDHVKQVQIHLNRDHAYTLLFDHDHHLQERIVQEQFSF
jgi:NAD+ kinase